MAGKNIGPTIGLGGEAEFRKQIKNINAELGVLEAQLGKSSAKFKDSENSQEALSEKTRILTEMNDKLSTAAEIVGKRHEEVSETYGENSEAALKLEKQLLNLEKQIINNNNQIEKNSSDFSENDNALDKNAQTVDFWAQNVQNKFNAAKDMINDALNSMISGLSALNSMMTDSASKANDITIMAERAGMTTQTFQELQYATQFLGLEMNTLTDSVMGLGEKAFDAVNNPGGETAQMFRNLKVEITDSNGKLKESHVIWEETLVALGNMSNETERNATATKLFGGAAKDLNSIMGTEGVQALKNYANEANNVGYVMDTSTLTALKSLNDEQIRAQNTIQGVKDRISAQLAPEFEKLTRTVADLLVAYEPLITNALEWLLNNLPQIAQGALAVAGGLIAMKIASSLISIINMMNTSLVTTNATLTMTNATLYMNPLVMIITGIVGAIGGLCAGVILFSDKADETVDSMKDMEDEMEEVETVAKELDESLNQVANSINWDDIDLDFKAKFAILGINSAAAFKEKLLSGLDTLSSDLSTKLASMEISFSPNINGGSSYTPVVIQNTPSYSSQPIDITLFIDRITLAELLYDPLSGIATQKGAK